MQLDVFFNYKTQLMNDLIDSEDILRLLTEDGSVPENPKELIYSQVFPFEYIPETVEHGRTYICCEVEVQKSMNKTFLLPELYIWVFSHKSKLCSPAGGVRSDSLASLIADKLNGSRWYGLGELELYSVRRFAPIADHQGKVMLFRTQDFNRQPNGGRNAPTNRKLGI